MTIHEDGIHWSKDFVEHLRTVHFALIAVSVGLIALSLAHPFGPLERALKQIREIQKVSEQRNARVRTAGINYSDWVQDWASVDVEDALHSKRIYPTTPEPSNVSCSTDKGQREYSIPQEWSLIHSADEEKIDPSFIRVQVPLEGSVVETEALGLPKDMKLDDFKKLWDVLNQHTIDVVVPIALRYKLYLWNGNLNRWDEYSCVGLKSDTSYGNFLHFGLVTDADRWAKLAPRVGDEAPRYGYVSDGNATFISLDQFYNVDFNGQGWFLNNNPTWKPGGFAESFPELNELSAGFSNQNLETVERVLKNKPNESAETFEAFGIKIPSNVVMRFGILLVIAVQLYFLTHLIELSKRLSPSDPGWEVAWIGVYDHILAKIVYFCTIAVLPILSIAALGKRGLAQFSSAQTWVILGAALGLDLLLAFCIWRRTPRRNVSS